MKRELLYFFIFLFSINFVFAIECPRGLINDPYPGQCGHYIDLNKDNICDLSQEITNEIKKNESADENKLKELISGKELKKKTVEEVAKIYNIDPIVFSKEIEKYLGREISIRDSFQFLHDNYELGPDEAKKIAIEIKTKEVTSKTISQVIKQNKKDYFLIQIGAVVIVFYFLSLYATKKNYIGLVNHRRFWNVILLFSFLGTAITGILLVLRITYGIVLNFPLNILFWHVETGILMSIISAFHILWHWSYFKAILKINKK